MTGAGGAVMLYFFYESQIISSDLFPNLTQIDTESTAQGQVFNKDFGKLLFWSFLAGFSERLVPDTLGRVERDFGAPRG
jgi:hypothetical protein